MTSLAEALLYNAGSTTRLGTVDAGNTVSDYAADEIERKISINTGILNADCNNSKLYLLDTPGYADFIGEVLASLRVADGAVLMIDAVSGIQVGTDSAWNLLKEHNIPSFIFINKIDKENAKFYDIVDSLKERYSKACLPFELPDAEGPSYKSSASIFDKDNISKSSDDLKSRADEVMERLMEGVAETDDALLEKYLEKGEISEEELRSGLHNAIINRKILPVF